MEGDKVRLMGQLRGADSFMFDALANLRAIKADGAVMLSEHDINTAKQKAYAIREKVARVIKIVAFYERMSSAMKEPAESAIK